MRELMGYLHKKTHFNASIALAHNTDKSQKVNLDDAHVVELCKDIQKVVNRRRKGDYH